jgi:amino acid transporter
MARRTDGKRPAGTEHATGQAVTLAVLVVIAAVALRGYVPGAEQAERERTTESPAATGLVMVLLLASITIVAVAVIARLRNRSASAAGTFDRADWLRRERSRPTWRIMVIAAAAVAVWLLAIMVLTRLGAIVAVGPPDAAAPESTPATRIPGTETTPPRQLPEPDEGPNLFGYFYGATVAFLLILVAGTIVAARRRRRAILPALPVQETRDGKAPDAASESLVRAAEVGLAEVGDLSREPRKAIIACYAAMEGELSRVPGAMPQDFDTASEVLDRAVAHHALGPDSATQLVDLFDEARFSPHVMTEAHRDAAVRVLQRVLAELRSASIATELRVGP